MLQEQLDIAYSGYDWNRYTSYDFYDGVVVPLLDQVNEGDITMTSVRGSTLLCAYLTRELLKHNDKFKELYPYMIIKVAPYLTNYYVSVYGMEYLLAAFDQCGITPFFKGFVSEHNLNFNNSALAYFRYLVWCDFKIENTRLPFADLINMIDDTVGEPDNLTGGFVPTDLEGWIKDQTFGLLLIHAGYHNDNLVDHNKHILQVRPNDRVVDKYVIKEYTPFTIVNERLNNSRAYDHIFTMRNTTLVLLCHDEEVPLYSICYPSGSDGMLFNTDTVNRLKFNTYEIKTHIDYLVQQFAPPLTDRQPLMIDYCMVAAKAYSDDIGKTIITIVKDCMTKGLPIADARVLRLYLEHLRADGGWSREILAAHMSNFKTPL